MDRVGHRGSQGRINWSLGIWAIMELWLMSRAMYTHVGPWASPGHMWKCQGRYLSRKSHESHETPPAEAPGEGKYNHGSWDVGCSRREWGQRRRVVNTPCTHWSQTTWIWISALLIKAKQVWLYCYMSLSLQLIFNKLPESIPHLAAVKIKHIYTHILELLAHGKDYKDTFPSFH